MISFITEMQANETIMGLHAKLQKRLRRFTMSIEFACNKGETLGIVGPSGAGQTTLLRMLAGLDRPDQGGIRMGSETWVDSEAKIFLPPQRRSAGLVFQDYNLFPHMTLLENVAFAATNKDIVSRLLTTFGISHLKDMAPRHISGGERQRGALCQALARMPRLLLLDEPFSALDLETRIGLRRLLRHVQAETPLCMVHVTHDLNEAFFLETELLQSIKGSWHPTGWIGRSNSNTRRTRLSLS